MFRFKSRSILNRAVRIDLRFVPEEIIDVVDEFSFAFLVWVVSQNGSP